MTTKALDAGSLPASSGQALLDALRSNLNLLGEIAMRYSVETQPERRGADVPAILTPADVYSLLGPEMAPLAQEQLRVLLLNIKGKVVGQRTIYQGNVNSSMIRPAEVLRPAVMEAVPSIIICHNHPSGDPTPSSDDVSVTRQLKHAADLLDIDLIDHVIIGGERFVSLRDRNLMS